MLFDRLKGGGKYRPGDRGYSPPYAGANAEVFTIGTSTNSQIWTSSDVITRGGVNNGAVNRGMMSSGGVSHYYIAMETPCASVYFGSLGDGSPAGGCSSGSNDRGVIPSFSGSNVHYVTLSTTSNSVSYGSNSSGATYGSCSNGPNDRAILGCSGAMTYMSISTGGASTSHCSLGRGCSSLNPSMPGCSSDTNERGVIGPNGYNNAIEYFTISTGGSALITKNDTVCGNGASGSCGGPGSVEESTVSNGCGDNGMVWGCWCGCGGSPTYTQLRMFNFVSLNDATTVGNLNYPTKQYGAFSNGYS